MSRVLSHLHNRPEMDSFYLPSGYASQYFSAPSTDGSGRKPAWSNTGADGLTVLTGYVASLPDAYEAAHSEFAAIQEASKEGFDDVHEYVRIGNISEASILFSTIKWKLHNDRASINRERDGLSDHIHEEILNAVLIGPAMDELILPTGWADSNLRFTTTDEGRQVFFPQVISRDRLDGTSHVLRSDLAEKQPESVSQS